MANRDFKGNFYGNDKLSKSTGSGFGNFLRQIGSALFGSGEDGKATGFFNTGLGKAIAGLINPVLGTAVNLIGGKVANKTLNNELTGKEREQNAFNAEQAQLNRDFQEEMSNTSYQRAVTDMQNAGVNPALAMSNGGASTPTGSNAQGSASVINPMTAMVEALKAFGELRYMKDQGVAAKMNAEAALKTADAADKNAETNSRNADTNERNASVGERQAAVAEARVEIERELKDMNLKIGDEQMKKIANEAANIKVMTDLAPYYYDLAVKNGNSQQIAAFAAMKSANAAAKNAETNERVGAYDIVLKRSYALLNDVVRGEHQEILNNLPEKLRQEIDNLKKQGYVLDQEGRLRHRQGNLASAQMVKTYTNVATDLMNSVCNVAGTFMNSGSSGFAPGGYGSMSDNIGAVVGMY